MNQFACFPFPARIWLSPFPYQFPSASLSFTDSVSRSRELFDLPLFIEREDFCWPIGRVFTIFRGHFSPFTDTVGRSRETSGLSPVIERGASCFIVNLVVLNNRQGCFMAPVDFRGLFAHDERLLEFQSAPVVFRRQLVSQLFVDLPV